MRFLPYLLYFRRKMQPYTKILFLLLLIVYLMLHIQQFSNQVVPPSNIIVSLSTVYPRLEFELPKTLRSLLSQSTSSFFIHIYYSETDVHNFTIARAQNQLFQHPRILWFPVADLGPATKYIPAIEKFKHDAHAEMIVCDDDRNYSSGRVETLLRYLRSNLGAVGTQGWRIRKDLQWGVSTWREHWYTWSDFDHHLVNGCRIKEPYQVGVITGNECYGLKPHWFKNVNLSDYANAPEGAVFVDDIWLNGHLAKLKIKRFVVPMADTSGTISRFSAIDLKMKHPSTRGDDNSNTLSYFADYFANEAIWYNYDGLDPPKWNSNL